MLSHKIVGPRDAVLFTDPAIDENKSDAEAYRDALFDFSAGHVAIKTGEKPTLWTIGGLTEAQKRHAQSYEITGVEWADFVFRCGIHGIKNYLVMDGDSEREPSPPDRKDRGTLGQMASEEWLHKSGLALADIQSVAMMIWAISEARVPLSKRSKPPAGG